MASYEQISPDDFAAAEGTGDWRVVDGWAHAVFATGSFAAGVALVGEIGRLADAANHHPDVLLSYPRVAVKVATHDTDSLTTADVDLARAISAAALAAGVDATPDAVSAW